MESRTLIFGYDHFKIVNGKFDERKSYSHLLSEINVENHEKKKAVDISYFYDYLRLFSINGKGLTNIENIGHENYLLGSVLADFFISHAYTLSSHTFLSTVFNYFS